MRDLSAELKSLNADWRALRDAAESLDCGAPDVWTMLMIELRAARSDTRLHEVLAEAFHVPAELVASEDTRLDDVLAELRAIRELLAGGKAVSVEQL